MLRACLSTGTSEADKPIIPVSVIEKPPSAELRPDQFDEDSLPPYERLDPILKAYVEDDMSFEEIVSTGEDPDVVKHVIGLVDRSEYKRRQAAPGIKITPGTSGGTAECQSPTGGEPGSRLRSVA